MGMRIKTILLIPTMVSSLMVMFTPLVQAQIENMTMEELTNASLAQYPEGLENVTTMEEETAAVVGNLTGNMTANMTSQNATYGNTTT
jgi:uncharacterized membrane protein AbrB (regulator of aidB expression)